MMIKCVSPVSVPLTLVCILVLSPAFAQSGSLSDMATEARSSVTGDYISFKEHRIDDEGLTGVPMRGADGLAIADFDGDGHFDIVTCHEDSSHLRLAFGTDDPDTWETATLASGDTVGAVEDAALGDLNGDGRPDIVCACEKGHLTIFLNPDTPREMAAWTPVIIQETVGRGSWIRTDLADLDADGDLEVLGANKGRTQISYFSVEGKAADPEAWHETVVGQRKRPINVRAVDIEGDGDRDIVAGFRDANVISVYENTGAGETWAEHVIHNGVPATEGFMFNFTDLDADGRLDIITEADHNGIVFWLKQPPNLDEKWPAYVIGDLGPDHATGLGLIDLTDDGRLDLFVGGYSGGSRETEPENIAPSDRCSRLAWFEQPREVTDRWRRHDVSRRRRGMFDMFIPVDVNKDGLMDLLTTRGNSGDFDGVLWLQQVRTEDPVPAFEQARELDSPQVPLPE